jgi:hypothetical protein
MDFLGVGVGVISCQSSIHVYISGLFCVWTVKHFFLRATKFCEFHENLIVANISRLEANAACSRSNAKITHHWPKGVEVAPPPPTSLHIDPPVKCTSSFYDRHLESFNQIYSIAFEIFSGQFMSTDKRTDKVNPAVADLEGASPPPPFRPIFRYLS